MFEWLTRLSVCGFIFCYFDSDYFAWVKWTYQPIIIMILLPFLILVLLYITVFLVQLYKLRRYLVSLVSDPAHDLLERCHRLVALLWETQGRIFHDYEIIGLDKLPKDGPAYIVYYHGTLPLDAYYFIARYYLEFGRFPCPVVDRFLFFIPGLKTLLELLNATPGTLDSCTRMLNDGRVVMLAPGGVKEAQFADEYYSILWGLRVGYAKVARKAGVPIYPMFTENCRDAVRVVQYGKDFFQRLYEKTRLPMSPLYGYFPVKLRTYIGNPIYCDPEWTDYHYADVVRNAVHSLISTHQIQPGNIARGLLQRIPRLDRYLWNRYRQSDRFSEVCNSSLSPRNFSLLKETSSELTQSSYKQM